MKGKRRTPLPKPPRRKRKHGPKPAPPRPKGQTERLAVRRLAAMQYRLAGASYRSRGEAHRGPGQRVCRRARRERRAGDAEDPHVSKRTAWDDVTAELEELRRETEMQRADLMALENARLDQGFSKALSLFASRRADWLSRRWDGGAFSLPDRCRYASRSEPVSRYAAHASYAGSLSVVSVIRRALLLVNHE